MDSGFFALVCLGAPALICLIWSAKIFIIDVFLARDQIVNPLESAGVHEDPETTVESWQNTKRWTSEDREQYRREKPERVREGNRSVKDEFRKGCIILVIGIILLFIYGCVYSSHVF